MDDTTPPSLAEASDAKPIRTRRARAKSPVPSVTIQRRPGGGACVRRAPPIRFTASKRQEFLERLAGSANVVGSAAATGIDVKQAYRLRKRDPEFAALWLAALAEAYERIETELLRRAIGGFERPIVWQGKEVSRIHEMDTGLMVKMLTLQRNKTAGPAKPVDGEARRRIDERLDELAERLRAPLPAGLSAHERGADEGPATKPPTNEDDAIEGGAIDGSVAGGADSGRDGAR